MDSRSWTADVAEGGDRKAYWEARLRADFSLGGVGYTELGEPFNRWIYRVRRHGIRRIIRGLDLPRGASVLDVGSGTGFMIDVWREARFQNVEGCDLTTISVEGLRRRFPSLRFLCMDISSAHVPYSKQFDAVSSNDVLFHIVDDAAYHRALKNIFEALRPGGYFVFSDNFLHGPALRSEHQVCRSLDEITSMLRQAGFNVIDRRPLFVLMNNPVDSSSRFLRVWWRRLSHVLRRRPGLGAGLGALLYGAEVALVRIVKDGPSTEVMVCRRPASGDELMHSFAQSRLEGKG